MFNLPDESLKCDDFINELKIFCKEHGYILEHNAPIIYISSPKGSYISFDATFRHKLHDS